MSPSDPAARARAERAVQAANLEASEAASRAKLAGSGSPGDTPKAGRLVDTYA